MAACVPPVRHQEHTQAATAEFGHNHYHPFTCCGCMCTSTSMGRGAMVPKWGFKPATSWSWVKSLPHSGIPPPSVVEDSNSVTYRESSQRKFFWIFYVFGSCFRMLEVIPVSDFVAVVVALFWKKGLSTELKSHHTFRKLTMLTIPKQTKGVLQFESAHEPHFQVSNFIEDTEMSSTFNVCNAACNYSL